jgi:thymidylate synthase (FAD)
MKIKLMQSTPPKVCPYAIRTCHNSHHLSSKDKDRDLVDKVGNKMNHASVLEHIVLTYEIKGISRACLMELTRHRMASYSVKSTRYTLRQELSREKPENFTYIEGIYYIPEDVLNKYCVLTGEPTIDNAIRHNLGSLYHVLVNNPHIKNDTLKYMLGEAFKTELVMTINMRSLQNLIKLRTSKSALKEIRELAQNLYATCPDHYKYLLNSYISK